MLGNRFASTGSFLTATAALLLAAALAAADGPSRALLGKKIDNVTLKDAAGKPFTLYGQRDPKAIVVVFLSFECPVSNSYATSLSEMAKQYGERGVAFVGVCPCDDDAALIAAKTREFQLGFPVFKDDQMAATKAFQAGYTPEAFLVDDQFVLRYRGRIDDSYFARLKRSLATSRQDLKLALDELLAGKPISMAATQPVGCAIPRQAIAATTGAVTFYRDVLPILQANCQSCHQPGEVAPFSLMTYRQAVNWADDIKEYTQNRKMPPWKPVDSHGLFLNERHMKDADIATLARWVDGGTPAGDPRDAPPARPTTDGWQLGQPDLVLEPPEDTIVAGSGRDLQRVFVFPNPFTEDKYLSAIEVRPGNKRVVHHTLHFADSTGKARALQQMAEKAEANPAELDRGPGYSALMGLGFIGLPPKVQLLGGWAPGMLYRHLPDGVGYELPKKADLVLQVHYHRTGKVERDRTRLGLYFAKKPVARPLRVLPVPGMFAIIPAGKDNYKVEGRIWTGHDLTLFSLMPHMHYLGKSIQATMTLPDGTTKKLVFIKEWDYNWQEFYYLKEPIHVPAGTQFDVTAYFDNSDKNPFNPNRPPRHVNVGEQTTEEMCFVFMGVAPDRADAVVFPRFTPPGSRAKNALGRSK